MTEEIKPEFINEDIATTEVVIDKKISNTTRKNITWATLVYVFIQLIQMFLGALIQQGEAIVTISFLTVGSLVLVWLGASFFLFYREERERFLLISSILVILGGVSDIPYYIIAGLDEYGTIALTESSKLGLNILSIFSTASLLAAFILMKLVLDNFRKQKRNIFRGQLSLPLGYLLHTIYLIMYTIIPLDSITYINAEGQEAILPEFTAFFNTAYFIELGATVMIVFGFWYLRRAYLILDKLPEDFFEKAEAMKTMRAQQRAPTRTMLGLGRDRPIPPAQKTDDEIKYESTVIPQEVSKDKKMFCVKCGLELEHDAVFCANCGEPNPYIKK